MEFTLPSVPQLEQVFWELGVIPVSFLAPKTLHQDLGPCGEWDEEAKWVVLPG